MKNKLKKQAGLALIIGSLIMLATMILHPAGGSIEHLKRISTLIISTHALAILSLPITLFGFWGLTRLLNHEHILSLAAFITIAFGLFAVMIAGAANGLTLPFFINAIDEISPETKPTLDIILNYNFALNKAMTFIYISANALAILFWSLRIIKTKRLTRWIGYYGLLLSVSVIIMFLSGFVFHDLHGFRLFIFGMVSWVILVGYLMLQSNFDFKSEVVSKIS